MKLRFACCLLGMLFAIGADSHAGGLIAKLPADGEWAEYAWTTTVRQNTYTGQLKLSHVGGMDFNGVACQWIEVQMNCDDQQEKHRLVVKLLIPEKEFTSKSNIGDLSQKTWFQIDDGPVVEKLTPADAPRWLQLRQHVLHHLLSPMQDVSELKEKSISFQKGNLKCDGKKQELVGDPQKVSQFGRNIEVKMKMERSLWLNPKVPFGVAACDSEEMLWKDDDKTVSQTVNVYLQDFGTGATSAVSNSQ